MLNRIISFLTGGQSDFLIPLSHQWHGINVAPALDAVALLGAFVAITLFGVGLWRAGRRHPSAATFLFALLFATAAYAASSTLSGLSSGSAISDSDLFYDVQSVGTGGVKVTGLQLKTYINAGAVTGVSAGCQTITSGGPGPVSISTQWLDSPNSPSASGGYTMQASDACTNLVLKSGYSGTLTIPASSTTGFGNGAYFPSITNESGLDVLVSVTTDTLGGFSSFHLGAGATFGFNSDGTNYHFTNGRGAISFQTGSSTGNTLPPVAGFFICTAACTVVPPVPVPGYQFCVMNDDNVSGAITLGALGSSARYENTARTAYGTAGTGTLSSAGAVGDMACIVGRDATHYLTPTFVGTWTAS